MSKLLLAFYLFLIILLSVRLFLFFSLTPKITEGENIAVSTTLLSEPSFINNNQQFSVRVGNAFSSKKVQVYAASSPLYHYSDSLFITGKIAKKTLKNNQVILVMYFPKIKNDISKNFVLAINYFIRQKITSSFGDILSPTSSSLLLGIVFGIKDNFPKSFMNNLQVSGVLHVIAASGMNVSLIGTFMLTFFTRFTKRQIAISLSIFAILFYSLLSGWQPSILRACFMMLAVLASQLFGRQYSSIYILIVVGVLMIIFTPELIFDVGFQLSFLATLGIIVIKPMFPAVPLLSDDLGTTIAAQIATLPILVAVFGKYSLISILVNGIVLWTIAPLMILGILAAIASFIFIPFTVLALSICKPILWFFESIVNFFGSSNLYLDLKGVTWPFIAGYYLILLSMTLLLRDRKTASEEI